MVVEQHVNLLSKKVYVLSSIYTQYSKRSKWSLTFLIGFADYDSIRAAQSPV